MRDDIERRFTLGKEVAAEAGELALSYFRSREKLTIKSKGLQDMASEADLNTELLIRDRIAKKFPSDAFLGEETGSTELSRDQGIWVVDPIDGTQPFVSGLSSWCVSIAYVYHNALQFGFVYAPARGEFFAGGLNHAATLNDLPVRRHTGSSIRDGIVGVGYSPRISPAQFLPFFGAFLQAGGMFYREGSGALTLCYVAAGSLLGYVEPHINSWDCLGAIAVIRAAGLRTNDFLSNDGLLKGNRVVAGSDSVFDELESLLDAHYVPPEVR